MLRRMARPFLAALLLGWALALPHARAQDAEPPTVDLTVEQAIELATRLLEQGRLDPAGRLIGRLRAAPEPPLQVLFLSGHLKLARGDVAGAVEEFREILRRDPQAVRVRLDLALALYRVRDYAAALYHFELALSADLPAQAKANALRFVRDIRQRESYWELNVALVSDSNVNYATRATDVPIGEARFRLSEDARAKAGTGLMVTVSGRESFGAGLDNYVSVYAEDTNFKASRFDLFYGALTLGHTFALGSHDVSAEAGGHYANWGERSLYDGWVAKLADNWRVRPDTLIAASFDARELRYGEFAFLTGMQYAFNLDATRALFGSTTVRVGASTIRQGAQSPSSAYDASGVRLELQSELPHAFTVGTRVETYWFRYGAPDTIFGIVRHDRRSLLELTLLRRDLRWRGFSPRLIVGYNLGVSNIPLFEFDRSYVRLAVTRQF
jgi:tetratricopeptide (TPR) repeat protein